MFTQRWFKLIVTALFVVGITLAVQQAFATKAITPETNRTYAEWNAQAFREYHLGERYGVTPEQYAHEKALREYWLGERYGQTP